MSFTLHGLGVSGGIAIGYADGIWPGLKRFLDDPLVPLDNNHLENQIRPWAMGRRAWLFAGSELAGETAKMNVTALSAKSM